MSSDINGASSAFLTSNPAIKGAYVFSIDKVTILPGATNYISLFNPVGSTRTISFGGAFISSTLLTSSSVTDSLRGWRTTAASAGTLQAASAITKFQLQYADPSAEVRTGNPTATTTSAFFNSPAPITDKGTSVHDVVVPAGAPPFLLTPGNGVVLRAEAGVASSGTWNLSIVWLEL